MKSLEVREKFIRLRGIGESFDSISEKLGISKKTLIAWSRLYAPELVEAKGKALDTVLEEYDLAKSGRIKMVAKEIARIDAELAKRDFSNIPTGKLVDMKIKALDTAGRILGDVETPDRFYGFDRIREIWLAILTRGDE